jgi:hypothetical protein
MRRRASCRAQACKYGSMGSCAVRPLTVLASCALVAMALGGCGSGGKGSSPSIGATDATGTQMTPKSGDGTPAKRPTPRVDSEIRPSLAARQPVRVLVTVGSPPGVIVETSKTPSSSSSLQNGPFLAAKSALLAAAGPDVKLIRDYDQMPVLLLSVRDTAALDRLTGSGLALSIQRERTNTVN